MAAHQEQVVHSLIIQLAFPQVHTNLWSCCKGLLLKSPGVINDSQLKSPCVINDSQLKSPCVINDSQLKSPVVINDS